MKIAIIGKADRFGGGAGKTADDLTDLLNNNGHQAHHYRRDLSKGYTKDSTSVYGVWEYIAKKVYYKLKYFGFQEIVPFELSHLIKEIKKNNYDLVHFHDLTASVSPYTLMYLSTKIPVVWTMHDCSPFTGGCISPLDCKKYMSDCKNCPQRDVWPTDGKFDFAFLYLKIKAKLHKKNIYLITPSKWLAKISTTNTIIKNNIPTVIPNGVNIDAYKPLNKKDSKEILNISKNRFTILLASHSINNRVKGLPYALEVLKKLKELNPYIILVGSLDKETGELFSGFDYISSGFIFEYSTLNLYYAASDIFLNCSIADNFPLVVLETMASGTPTFGFKTGGMSEMVENDINGYLVDESDVNLLANKIKEVYVSNRLEELSLKSREIVEGKFSYSKFLDNHINFYKKVIKSFKNDQKR